MAPSYVSLLESGELQRRADALQSILERCCLCPWRCGVDRGVQTGKCRSGKEVQVADWGPHFGEEPCLSGTHLPRPRARGCGNIFLGQCNLRCVYCQNWEISQGSRRGEVMDCRRLAGMMLALQEAGCHNIGLVSPTHFSAQILRAVALAAEQGLRLPLIYNTNAYDSVEVLQLLDGVFDIYLPDLKYSSSEVGREYSRIPNYVEHARAAIAEMFRQVGPDLQFDGQGMLQRGLLIRLLVLPNGLAGLKETLEWIATTLSPRVALSILHQYHPAYKVDDTRYAALNRRITWAEYEQVLDWAADLGFDTGWMQPLRGGQAIPLRAAR